jgi:energy-coupling factor transport system permease protein
MYVARESGLHRLNPNTRLSLTLSLLVVGLALSSAEGPGAWTCYVLIATVLLPLAAWGGVLGRLVSAVARISWPFVVSVFLIQSAFWSGGTPLLEAGPLTLKREGALFALASIGRILLVMTDFLLFSITTRPDRLMISLKQAGMPAALAYVIVTTLQIVPRFVAKAGTILDAQRSRGLETEGHLLVRARALVPLVLPLVLGSLLEVEERAIAIEARAFNSGRAETSLIDIPDSRLQHFARLGCAALALAALAARFLWPS